jgi:hypothetical protein
LLQDSTIISEKDDDVTSVSTSQSVDELSEGYFNMPVDMVREGIEKSFRERCRQLKEVMRGSFRKRCKYFELNLTIMNPSFSIGCPCNL